jgi:hypothetical protein
MPGAAAAMFDFSVGDGLITCDNCGYINVGNLIPSLRY